MKDLTFRLFGITVTFTADFLRALPYYVMTALFLVGLLDVLTGVARLVLLVVHALVWFVRWLMQVVGGAA